MKSAYADRDTVGTIALKARQSNETVCVGDMAHEFMPQLVEDLNEAISSNPFDDRPFYIIVHEKKDLQLINVILRRVIKQEYRPYPEVATQVYWTNPKTQETRFCWSLPHKSEFINYLNNASHYNKDQIKDILAYNMERLGHFGFSKYGVTELGVPIYHPIEGFKDRKLKKKG
jgi:hypothetical protein